jgi:DNA (cytosine-5)-methyltransferase 1
MSAYYNEWEAYPAQWLRNLIKAGLIAPGDVDERSIKDVKADDLKGYTQCHFFAGIGGWSYALRLAGWDDDRRVWTGSCPCQPFSAGGLGKGENDERHLWPDFYCLIAQCKPPIVFGEQVESKAGRDWFAGVRNNMEALGYESGGADLCAASVGAPHKRQRIFWVADAIGSHVIEWEKVQRQAESTGGSWEQFQKFDSPDKRARRIEQGTSPLAYGVSFPMGSVRAYGNAIVPQVAAEFITAFMEVRP